MTVEDLGSMLAPIFTHTKTPMTTAAGRLVFVIFAALAEFEREWIGERTGAGLKAARVRGRTGGRARR